MKTTTCSLWIQFGLLLTSYLVLPVVVAATLDGGTSSAAGSGPTRLRGSRDTTNEQGLILPGGGSCPISMQLDCWVRIATINPADNNNNNNAGEQPEVQPPASPQQERLLACSTVNLPALAQPGSCHQTPYEVGLLWLGQNCSSTSDYVLNHVEGYSCRDSANPGGHVNTWPARVYVVATDLTNPNVTYHQDWVELDTEYTLVGRTSNTTANTTSNSSPRLLLNHGFRLAIYRNSQSYNPLNLLQEVVYPQALCTNSTMELLSKLGGSQIVWYKNQYEGYVSPFAAASVSVQFDLTLSTSSPLPLTITNLSSLTDIDDPNGTWLDWTMITRTNNATSTTSSKTTTTTNLIVLSSTTSRTFTKQLDNIDVSKPHRYRFLTTVQAAQNITTTTTTAGKKFIASAVTCANSEFDAVYVGVPAM